MKKATLIGLFMTILSSHVLASSKTHKTDLGIDGNSYVLARNSAFSKGLPSCLPKDEDSFRVVLQGFSLFSGVDMNISGAVVDTFGGLPLEERSLLQAENNGSRVKQVEIEVAGKKVELCLVVSEVLWDLAAANLIKVIEDFKPDFVLMSGRGGSKATIETGARNQASTLSGYSYNGNYSGNMNRPRSLRVDGRYESSKIIPSTWNFEAIEKAVTPLIENLGHKVTLGIEGRKDNDYICNNIHYSILQAVTEGDVELAGGILKPLLALETLPAMGFFHYPSGTLKKDKDVELKSWMLVIKELIRSQLNL